MTTISNSFCPSYTNYFTYLASFASLRTTFKANGAYETINHFACNFAKCSPIIKKFFHQHIKQYICNEVTYHNLNAWIY